MSKTRKSSQQILYVKYKDLGYALGKEIMLYTLFEKKREKEIERLWSEQIDPFNDEDFKIRFVEEKDEYTFIMYRETHGNESSFGFYKMGFEIAGHYIKFKNSFNDELLFTYGIPDDGRFRVSERYKVISDVEILENSEIERGSHLWDLLNLENADN